MAAMLKWLPFARKKVCKTFHVSVKNFNANSYKLKVATDVSRFELGSCFHLPRMVEKVLGKSHRVTHYLIG
jgi:hypothetical protein